MAILDLQDMAPARIDNGGAEAISTLSGAKCHKLSTLSGYDCG